MTSDQLADWMKAAQDEYINKPLPQLRNYELDALVYYLTRLCDVGDQQPETPQEERIDLYFKCTLAMAKLEQAKREAAFAEQQLKAHELKHGIHILLETTNDQSGLGIQSEAATPAR